MAVVDKYTDSIAEADKGAPFTSAFVKGGELIAISAIITPAAGDSANSVYRFFKGVSSNLIPLKLELATSSNVSTGTCEVGLYYTDKGAAIDSDVLSAALSTATASRTLDAMASVAIGDFQKTLGDLAGIDSAKVSSVDIGVKALSAFGAQAIALRGIFLKKY